VASAQEESVLSSPEVAAEESLAESNGVGIVVDESNVCALNPPGRTEANEKRIARYQASQASSHEIKEGDRPLAEYMTLPVSQYSVLDADKVERLDDSTFRVQTSTVNFFGIKLTPVMKLSVRPHSTGCEVQMLDCTLEGSQVASDANQKFACRMRNYISFIEDEEIGQLKLTADCIVQVAGIVPRWINAIVPISFVNNVGQKMLAKILEVAMPRFLLQLEKDYLAWASGDDSRSAMSTGDSFGLDDEVISVGSDDEQ